MSAQVAPASPKLAGLASEYCGLSYSEWRHEERNGAGGRKRGGSGAVTSSPEAEATHICEMLQLRRACRAIDGIALWAIAVYRKSHSAGCAWERW